MRDHETTKNNLIALLDGNGANVSAACEAVQISRQTFYTWAREDESFAAAIHAVREKVLDNIETALYKEAISGNITAAALILNARGKSRGYGQQGFLQGDGQGVKRVIIMEMPDNPMFTDMEPTLELQPGASAPEKS